VKILFLESSARDLNWFFDYYRSIFPAGNDNAKKHYFRAKAALRQNPYIGHPLEDSDLRELPVARTPFSFIYRMRTNTIEVVRVWDQRADRPAKWT
jgi:plasmid stabilization system protein ParE